MARCLYLPSTCMPEFQWRRRKFRFSRESDVSMSPFWINGGKCDIEIIQKCWGLLFFGVFSSLLFFSLIFFSSLGCSRISAASGWFTALLYYNWIKSSNSDILLLLLLSNQVKLV